MRSILNLLEIKLIPYNQHRTSFVPALSILDILMFNEQSEISTFLSNIIIKFYEYSGKEKSYIILKC